MNDELSVLVQVGRKLTLLTETLERSAAEAAHLQRQTSELQRQTLAQVGADVHQLIEQTEQQVAELVRRSVNAALSEGAAQYNQAINTTANRLDGTRGMFEMAAKTISADAARKLWTGYMAIMGAMALVVLGGVLLLWFEWWSYSDARARMMQAQVSAEVIQAYEQVGLTSCGGRPCLRLNTRLPR